MNFDFDDDQRSIKSTAREFLASRSKLEKVREASEGGRYDEDIWNQMRELGWAGIFIPESYGGQELGVVELVILQEELGYAVTPSPFFSNAAAGLMVLHAGSDQQKERLLPGIASGEATGTVGVLRNGSAPLVPDAERASFIVLVEDGAARVVEAGSAAIEHRDTIDGTRSFARVSGEGEALEGDVQGGLDRIATALAAELTGCSQRAMEMAVEYAKDRKQFDRPIGAYQAVSHRCAEMLLETEGARAATYYAGWAADNQPESLPVAASMAKAYASDAGWRVSSSSLQVHGGIGFTWEHDLHFILKRAKTDGHLFGGASEHRDRVASIAGLG
ncbi:MAG: acyl-CoA/acyl-ACP dehydrogenase [Thermoleophilaceae bacterium]|nr:acyl-CoA/acyl-ACP dehydrogenase [Thermoleophilaceae bacterium]